MSAPDQVARHLRRSSAARFAKLHAVMEVIEWERVGPATVGTGLGFRAGAAFTELTPPMGTWTAGWGPGLTPRRATHFVSKLFARVLVLDDGAGERVALITADLHAGTRYLCERVAALTASEGFHVGRVVLVGAHNHAGPGNLYGTPYFDAFCTSYPWVRGFHRELAEDLSERIADAVKEACAVLRPARVGHGVAPLWNWTTNRSLEAALNNFQGQSESEMRARLTTLHGAPGEVHELERLALDPRVQVLAATALDGTPIGAFATFAGHAALLAREHGALGGDWFGVAQQTAESLLEARTGVRPVIGLGAGAIGDVDPRPPGMSLAELISRRQRSLSDNLVLVKDHGTRLGAALVEAFDQAGKSATQRTLSVRFIEAKIQGETVPTKRGPRQLPHEPRIGASTLAGSELGPGFLSEGLRDEDPANANDPHWPKIDDDLGMAVIQPVLDVMQFLPSTLPLRLVQVGNVAVVGLSGEPTTWLAHRLSQLVQSSTPATQVIVAGTCGDYSGYFTTGREYELQHYEGASTLWGRYTERWLHQAIERLAKTDPVIPSGTARFVVEPFTGVKRRRRADVERNAGPPKYSPKLQRVAGKLRISGALRAGAPVPMFEWGDWLRVEADGMSLPIEPHVLLDELGGTLWWSVELADRKEPTLTVVLNHHDGSGRFTLK
jgi:neutral ceramidase